MKDGQIYKFYSEWVSPSKTTSQTAHPPAPAAPPQRIVLMVVEHNAHLVKFLGVIGLILLADAEASVAIEYLTGGFADEGAGFGRHEKLNFFARRIHFWVQTLKKALSGYAKGFLVGPLGLTP
ncbi:MAG: hypothetical protein EOO61_10480 [Hymenobacter sp.]|nr:MAG: hypothetical protein EOO61_10480 [Hymenobacter sp.]